MYYRYEEQKRLFWRKQVVVEVVSDDDYRYINNLYLQQNGKPSTVRQIPGGTFTVVPFLDKHGRQWEWVNER